MITTVIMIRCIERVFNYNSNHHELLRVNITHTFVRNIMCKVKEVAQSLRVKEIAGYHHGLSYFKKV